MPGGSAPVAGVGTITSDGVSAITGGMTENQHGQVCTFTLSGSYTVNPDGTGTIHLNERPVGGTCTEGSMDHSSVLFKTGKRPFVAQTSGGVLFGSLTKQ